MVSGLFDRLRSFEQDEIEVSAVYRQITDTELYDGISEFNQINNEFNDADRQIQVATDTVSDLGDLIAAGEEVESLDEVDDNTLLMYEQAAASNYSRLGLTEEQVISTEGIRVDLLHYDTFDNKRKLSISLEESKGVFAKIWGVIVKAYNWFIGLFRKSYEALVDVNAALMKKAKKFIEIHDTASTQVRKLSPDEREKYAEVFHFSTSDTKYTCATASKSILETVRKIDVKGLVQLLENKFKIDKETYEKIKQSLDTLPEGGGNISSRPMVKVATDSDEITKKMSGVIDKSIPNLKPTDAYKDKVDKAAGGSVEGVRVTSPLLPGGIGFFTGYKKTGKELGNKELVYGSNKFAVPGDGFKADTNHPFEPQNREEMLGTANAIIAWCDLIEKMMEVTKHLITKLENSNKDMQALASAFNSKVPKDAKDSAKFNAASKTIKQNFEATRTLVKSFYSCVTVVAKNFAYTGEVLLKVMELAVSKGDSSDKEDEDKKDDDSDKKE